MDIAERVRSLGLVLPEAPKPGGNYVALNVRGNVVYVAIQFPKLGDQRLYTGRLGSDLTTEEGYEGAKLCALNILAQVASRFAIAQLAGLNHLDAYFQAAPEWDQSPRVMDGASDLFVAVLGDKGIHSRAIFGVERLPKNFSVGITASFTLQE